nr:hypothetical protein Iba_chr11dCG10760 [Ipomoea batatas]
MSSYNADLLDFSITTCCTAKEKPQFNGEASSAKQRHNDNQQLQRN